MTYEITKEDELYKLISVYIAINKQVTSEYAEVGHEPVSYLHNELRRVLDNLKADYMPEVYNEINIRSGEPVYIITGMTGWEDKLLNLFYEDITGIISATADLWIGSDQGIVSKSQTIAYICSCLLPLKSQLDIWEYLMKVTASTTL